MSVGRRRFELDRENAKIFGVCAGLANFTHIDATLLRFGLVLATFWHGFPWTLIAYAIAAVIARPRRQSGGYMDTVRTLRGDAPEDRSRSLDLRMKAIENYVASANSPLAREIDSLR